MKGLWDSVRMRTRLLGPGRHGADGGDLAFWPSNPTSMLRSEATSACNAFRSESTRFTGDDPVFRDTSVAPWAKGPGLMACLSVPQP